MKDKICLITGATSGIGEITARELAIQGAHVILLARNPDKAEKVQKEIIAACGHDKVDILLADLASLQAVKTAGEAFMNRYTHLDVLINNAGLIAGNAKEYSKDGHELSLAVNHLAPFLLTSLLLPSLEKSREARVINVASEAYKMAKPDWDHMQLENNYSAIKAYGNSKLYNILFTRELARRLEDQGNNIDTYVLHPGVVASNFSQSAGGVMHFVFKLMRPFLISPAEGAKTSIFLATAERGQLKQGGYYIKKKSAAFKSNLVTVAHAQKLWQKSEEILNIKFL